MNVISLRGIKKSYGDKDVLTGMELHVRIKERIGLIGINGAGKTTAANILAGELEPDEGVIESSSDHLNIGYLRQSVEYSSKTFKAIEEAGHDKGFYTFASLMGLRKLKKWNEEDFGHLSGGERIKLALAHVWASSPDLLILDEPTNHLDQEGIEWLIGELQVFPGAVVIISHDRYFLDETVTRIFELEKGEAKAYDGNYSAYHAQKAENRRIEQIAYENQQKDIRRIESQMEQLQNWSDKAHRESTKQGGTIGAKEYHRVKAKKMDIQVKSKRKRLESELRKHKAEKPEEEPQVDFRFLDAGKHGKRIIEVKKLNKHYGEEVLFENSHFYVKRGERFALTGSNGSGKTTLLRILCQEENATDGEVWVSPGVSIGYMSQDVGDLPADKSAIEVIGLHDREEQQRAKLILTHLGLSRDDIIKPMQALSLGQRTKVKLACLLLHGYELLILDEPTNHLDLISRERLESALASYQGTVIAVSHDRFFLNKICDKRLHIENKQIKRLEDSVIMEEKTDSLEEQLMVMETEMTALLGKLSERTAGDGIYEQLDERFNALASQKKDLLKNKR